MWSAAAKFERSKEILVSNMVKAATFFRKQADRGRSRSRAEWEILRLRRTFVPSRMPIEARLMHQAEQQAKERQEQAPGEKLDNANRYKEPPSVDSYFEELEQRDTSETRPCNTPWPSSTWTARWLTAFPGF
jgi:hypothetical protein